MHVTGASPASPCAPQAGDEIQMFGKVAPCTWTLAASLRLHLPPQLRRALETGWRTQSDQRNETFNFVLRAMAERSLCGDQTSTCRNNPAVAPENNRINCAKPRDGVAAGNLPDPIGSLQHSPSISNLPYYPSINGSRFCFREWGRVCFRLVMEAR